MTRPARAGAPRSSLLRWIATWTAAVLAGLAVMAAVVVWQDHAQERDQERTLAERIAADRYTDKVPDPVDLVREISADPKQRVVVAPELADRIDPADLAAARAALADAEVPGWLAYLPYPSSDRGYTNTGLVAQWMEAVGADGHYLVLWDQMGSVTNAARGMDEEYLEAETKGQPGPALVRIAEEMAHWPDTPSDAETVPTPPSDSYYGGRVGGTVAGLLFAALTVGPLLGIAWGIAAARSRKEP